MWKTGIAVSLMVVFLLPLCADEASLIDRLTLWEGLDEYLKYELTQTEDEWESGCIHNVLDSASQKAVGISYDSKSGIDLFIPEPDGSHIDIGIPGFHTENKLFIANVLSFLSGMNSASFGEDYANLEITTARLEIRKGCDPEIRYTATLSGDNGTVEKSYEGKLCLPEVELDYPY